MTQVHHQTSQTDFHCLHCPRPTLNCLRHPLQDLFLAIQGYPHQHHLNPSHQYQGLFLMTQTRLHPLEVLQTFELHRQQINLKRLSFYLYLSQFLFDCLCYFLSSHLDHLDHHHQNLCCLSDHLSYQLHLYFHCQHFQTFHPHLTSYHLHPGLSNLHQISLSQLFHLNLHHPTTSRGLQMDHCQNHCLDQLLNFQDFWNHMIQHPMYYQILPNDHTENFQCYLSNRPFFQVLLNCLFHQLSLIH